MICQDCQAPFNSKVNYVDKNNRVVGFDMDSHCCEDFGHMVTTTKPPEDIYSSCWYEEMSEFVGDLEPYTFADEGPVDCLDIRDESGGGLAYRIVAKGEPDMWVVIWNHHNGYYSHGFEDWRDEGWL